MKQKIWWSIHFKTAAGSIGDTAEFAISIERAREQFIEHHPEFVLTEIAIESSSPLIPLSG